MKKKYKFITIAEMPHGAGYAGKPIYAIYSNRQKDDRGMAAIFGDIMWAPEWKQWVFSPPMIHKSEFSVSCLTDIINFIENEGGKE